MRVLLFSFFVSFTTLSIAQNFHEKYDIDGFIEIADYTELKSTFKEFKTHLESQGVRFDKLFRQEYESELVNYPGAMVFYEKYNRERIIGYAVIGLGVPVISLAMGAAIYAVTLGSESAGVISGVLTAALLTPSLMGPVMKGANTRFLDSLLIYHTAYSKRSELEMKE
ncbi:MAG: hypothetical protein ACPG7H_08325 [Crocinitomicaceae bacterium]